MGLTENQWKCLEDPGEAVIGPLRGLLLPVKRARIGLKC